MPQLLLSAVFITKTGQFDPIVMVSLMSSLWSLTSRVSSDDKALFKETWRSLDFSHKSCPPINFRYALRVFARFLEISSRVALLTLMWINLGGLATGIIIGCEFIYLLIISFMDGSIGDMGNLMYLTRDCYHYLDRPLAKFGTPLWKVFVFYRLISSYIYLILVTCFANIPFEATKVDDYQSRKSSTMKSDSVGFYMFFYCWIVHFIWPCLMYFLLKNTTRDDELDGQYTTRNIADLYYSGEYIAIFELIHFGKNNFRENIWRWRDKDLFRKIAAGEKASGGEIPPNIRLQAEEYCLANKIDLK